jgi:hypothetical protein
MPAFGVSDTFGLTAPSGYLQSSESSTDVEVATIKGATGQTVEAIPKPRKTQTVTVKTKGTASLSSVTSGTDFSGITLTSSKFAESNDDFGTSEITGILYSNL